MPLQPDNDTGLSILRDVEAFEAKVQKAVEDLHAQARTITEELRNALVTAPAAPAQGF